MSSPPSPTHAGIKRPLTIDDQDEDVRIAVRALGDMRSRAVAHAHAPSAEAFAAAAKAQSHSRTSSTSQSTPLLSTSTSTSISSPVSSSQDLESVPDNEPKRGRLDVPPTKSRKDSSNKSQLDPSSKDFVSRVSHLPIVNTALKAYEHSKERSRAVKYGANLMENSVKIVSRPVFDRLPVDQLEEFACRQLDRLGYPRSNTIPRSSSPEQMQLDPSEGSTAPSIHTPSSSAYSPRSPPHQPVSSPTRHSFTSPYNFHTYRDAPPSTSVVPSRAPSLAPSSSTSSPLIVPHSIPGSPGGDDDRQISLLSNEGTVSNDHQVCKISDRQISTTSDDRGMSTSNDRQVASRSKWHAVLSEAGGLGAAVSEESMKRLQYCLQWLQYATAHIDSQIVILRSFIDSLNQNQNSTGALVPLQTMRSLTDVRKDVVGTIRQVVDVISKYAGGSLPEPARSTVRSFIMRLPARWANGNLDRGSRVPNPNLDRAGLPPHLRPTAGRATHHTVVAAQQAAQRVLTLATESLDMMRSVTGVFKESLDRAETWVERLRVVGIQRQHAHSQLRGIPHGFPAIPGADSASDMGSLTNLSLGNADADTDMGRDDVNPNTNVNEKGGITPKDTDMSAANNMTGSAANLIVSDATKEVTLSKGISDIAGNSTATMVNNSTTSVSEETIKGMEEGLRKRVRDGRTSIDVDAER